MKKLLQLGGVIAASLLTTTSCQNEEIVDSHAQGQQVTLTVGRASGSRTALDGDKTVWSKGDKIYVSSKDGKTTGVLTLQGNGGDQTGTFSGFVFGNPESLAYSVYPAPTNGTIIDLSNISATGQLNAPMIGAINHNSDTNVAFQNQCGILYVSMNGSEGKTFQISGTDIDENNGTTTTNTLKFAGSFDVTKINWSTDGTTPSLKFNGETSAIQVTNTNTAGSNSGVVYVPFYITNDIELDKVTFTANNTPMNNEPIDFTATNSGNFIGAVAQDKIKDLQYSETGSILPFLAQIGDKTYVSLQEAIDAADANAEIQLLEDITLAEPAVVEQGKNVTIDLKGKTINTKDKYILNKGILVIENGSLVADTFNETTNGAPLYNTNGSLIIKDNANISGVLSAVRVEEGDVTIDGGTLRATSNTGKTASIIRMKGGNLTINNGTFIGCADTNGSEGCSIINPTGGTTTINGGYFSNFSPSPGSIFANGKGVTVKGGTFEFTPVDNWSAEQSFAQKGYLADGYKVVQVDGNYCIIATDTEMVTTNEQLKAAIESEIARILLADGNYSLRFTNNVNFNVDNLTITGYGDNVRLSIASSEVWYGRVQGDNVAFENINFTSSVGTTGKATYYNCKFENWAICASSGAKSTFFNNCVINGTLNTSSDFNSGNVYVNDSYIAKAEYSFSSSNSVMHFEDCVIGELISWNANTIMNGCSVENQDLTKVTSAIIIIDGEVVKIPEEATTVSNAEELSAALASNYDIILLANDIEYNADITLDEGVTLYGNNHKVTYAGTDDTYHLVCLSTNSVVRDVTFDNYRVRTEGTTAGDITMENVVINMDNDLTGLDISRGSGIAMLTNVVCKSITDEAHLNPETQVQAGYTPYGDVLLGTKWALKATDCEFGSLHGWNTTNGSNVWLNNTNYTVFRMHYWNNRTLYIDGVETAWSESGAIPVAHDVGGCWSVQSAFK